ncbi:MAG: alpha/beta fold hydrolase [Chloroflexota bacterium]|nr:alpha/beta fold hydrolase [Chloroflexota bacterium]
MNPKRLIFIHGLEGSSQGYKAKLLRGLFPGILIPDFTGTLKQRMNRLSHILSLRHNWVIIGSSFGGLMGAIFACHHPQSVQKLILLAPALVWPEFACNLPDPVSTPTVIYHGRDDGVIPLDAVRQLAVQVFINVDIRVMNDDHVLHKTAQEIDWLTLLQKD